MEKDKRHTMQNCLKNTGILISDIVCYKAKTVIKDKEGYFIIITDSIYKANKTVLNLCEPNNITLKYIKAKPDRTRRTSMEIHSQSGIFQHISLNNWQEKEYARRMET